MFYCESNILHPPFTTFRPDFCVVCSLHLERMVLISWKPAFQGMATRCLSLWSRCRVQSWVNLLPLLDSVKSTLIRNRQAWERCESSVKDVSFIATFWFIVLIMEVKAWRHFQGFFYFMKWREGFPSLGTTYRNVRMKALTWRFTLLKCHFSSVKWHITV